jgi:hypothetical protein
MGEWHGAPEGFASWWKLGRGVGQLAWDPRRVGVAPRKLGMLPPEDSPVGGSDLAAPRARRARQLTGPS